MGDKGGDKTKILHIYLTYSYQNKKEILITIIALGTATGYFLSLPFHISFALASTSAGCGSFPGGVTQTFIPGGSEPFIVLPELDCCNFPLTFITGHSDRLKGSPL